MTEADQVDNETDDKVEFKFAELSDEAKRVALEWFRVVVNSDWEPEYEDIVTCFGFLGIEFDQESYRTMGGSTMQRPAIEYQLSWCQGDGAVFRGKWKAEDMDIAALHEHAPQDTTLHDIGRQLTLILLRWPTAWARIKTVNYGPGLSGMSIEADESSFDEDLDPDIEDQMNPIIGACAQWIYDQFRSDLEWQGADEQCIEGIEANDYTFDEEGNHI